MDIFRFSPVLFWLCVMILFLVIEAVTVGLATIWFAAGALAALAAGLCGVGMIGQVAVFFAVSLALLVFTRPVAVKYINPNKVRTNYEDAEGKTARVVSRVDNRAGTGCAVLNGQEWTARMQDDEMTLEKGELGKVSGIEGVKLILVPLPEESK